MKFEDLFVIDNFDSDADYIPYDVENALTYDKGYVFKNTTSPLRVALRPTKYTEEELIGLILRASQYVTKTPLKLKDMFGQKKIEIPGLKRPLYVADPEFFGCIVHARNGWAVFVNPDGMSWRPNSSIIPADQALINTFQMGWDMTYEVLEQQAKSSN